MKSVRTVEEPVSCASSEAPSYYSFAYVLSCRQLPAINEATKRRQFLSVLRQQEGKRDILSADSKSLGVAAEQAEELIVIPGLLGCVYAIINLGTCLFAWD